MRRASEPKYTAADLAEAFESGLRLGENAVDRLAPGFAEGFVAGAASQVADPEPRPDAYLPTTDRAPRPAGPCPRWCQVDHELDLDVEHGIRLHARKVGPGVEVLASDDLQEGTRTQAEVVVHSMSVSTVGAAQGVALAILEAADSIEDRS